MAAKVFCVISPKGGSGKTTITASFGAVLSSLGKKVLLIDTDSGTNGLTLFYLQEMQAEKMKEVDGRKIIPKGIFESCNDISDINFFPLPNGVDLLPSSYSFFNTENVELGVFKKALENVIQVLSPSYHYIFIDAQSGSELITEVSIKREISDQVIIVSEYDPMSAAGVERLKSLFSKDLTFERTWYLLNKMLPEFVKSFSEFLSIARYLTPLIWDAEVVRAYAKRKLALDLVNGNEFTLAFLQTIKSLLGDEIEEEIKAWSKDRAEVFRKPIEEQYDEIEKELLALENKQHYIKEKEKRKNKRIKGFLSLLFICVFFSFFLILNFSQPRSIGSVTSYELILVFFLLLFVGICLLFYFLPFNILSFNSIEESKDRRQREILEEKIKSLEMLKFADTETFIRNKLTLK